MKHSCVLVISLLSLDNNTINNNNNNTSNNNKFSYLQCIGLQDRSVPPTWVIGSNFHVQMVDGVARRLSSGHSPYAVLGSELTPLPFINVEGLKFQTAIIPLSQATPPPPPGLLIFWKKFFQPPSLKCIPYICSNIYTHIYQSGLETNF